MKETNLLSIERLRYFFGGYVTITHNKFWDRYRIILKSDDLTSEFVFEFTGAEVDKDEQAVVTRMLDKYDKQMQLEQRMKTRGLQK